MFHVGGNANFSVFRFQHVGIPNAKLSLPKPGPNVNGFASQGNIGFILGFSRTEEERKKFQSF